MRRLLTLCLAFVLLSGCASAPARTSSDQTAPARNTSPAEGTFFAMDTVMSVRVYGDEALLDAAEDRVKELEALWSVTDENSEISALNRDGSAALSGDVAGLLADALELCGRTGGALDITIYPVVRLWGFTTGEYTVPEAGAVADLLTRVDYTRVALDENAGTASLPDGVEIDLGSVAKGYTGDVLSGLLKEYGVESALLDLGGNIQTVGAKPDGSPWRIGVRDPEDENGYIGVVEVADRAVVTSGGYERYFEQDGVRYWHIIDPATGAPARSGLHSVTVIGESCLVCDALSTALFVMGLDRALEHWREYRDFEAVFVAEDGSVTITAGLEGSFALSQTGRVLTAAQP